MTDSSEEEQDLIEESAFSPKKEIRRSPLTNKTLSTEEVEHKLGLLNISESRVTVTGDIRREEVGHITLQENSQTSAREERPQQVSTVTTPLSNTVSTPPSQDENNITRENPVERVPGVLNIRPTQHISQPRPRAKMESFPITQFSNKPGEDIMDTIESVEISFDAGNMQLAEDRANRAKALLLRGALHNIEGEDDGPKTFVNSLSSELATDFNLLSEQLKERYPKGKPAEQSRLKFFNDLQKLRQLSMEFVEEYVKRGRKMASGLKSQDRELLNRVFIDKLNNKNLRIAARSVIAAKALVKNGPVNEIPSFEVIISAVMECCDDPTQKPGEKSIGKETVVLGKQQAAIVEWSEMLKVMQEMRNSILKN